jgi:glycosyltransferase involved in cell wall biosynthesis
MKICVDVNVLRPPRTGIENYVHYLLNYLFKIDKENQYVLLSSKKFDINFFNSYGTEFVKDFLSLPLKPALIFWYNFFLPVKFKKYKCDLLFSPDFFSPIILNIPSISVVHDLTPLLYPKFHTFKNYIRFKYYLPLSLRKNKKIITVSNATKQDIMNIFKIPEEKIVTIYPGVDREIFKPISNSDILNKVKEKYNLPYKFILFVSTLEPRKNLPTLLKALYNLKRKQSIPHKLVCVGKKGWFYENIFEMVKNLNLEDDVIFTGYVPDEDLVAIYNLAEVLVYPSFYEGFGFPILEAMSCGCPVIASNTSSMPEVVGDAGILIDPYSEEDIERAILMVLEKDNLRNELKEKSLNRASYFSWENTAKEVLKCFYEIF